MKTSEIGKLFIKSYEKFSSKMYLDQGGRPTTAYGHLIEKDDPMKYMTRTITQEEGDRLFDTDLYYKAEMCVNHFIRETVIQYKYDALVSLTFNIGCGNFSTSTLVKKINTSSFTDEEISDEFLKWNKVRSEHGLVVSTGLVKRRLQERRMFLGEIAILG